MQQQSAGSVPGVHALQQSGAHGDDLEEQQQQTAPEQHPGSTQEHKVSQNLMFMINSNDLNFFVDFILMLKTWSVIHHIEYSYYSTLLFS